jgi:hypothetical protein
MAWNSSASSGLTEGPLFSVFLAMMLSDFLALRGTA